MFIPKTSSLIHHHLEENILIIPAEIKLLVIIGSKAMNNIQHNAQHKYLYTFHLISGPTNWNYKIFTKSNNILRIK